MKWKKYYYIKQLRLFCKNCGAEEIGRGNEIILSKIARGIEIRKLRLGQQKGYSWMGGCKSSFKDSSQQLKKNSFDETNTNNH